MEDVKEYKTKSSEEDVSKYIEQHIKRHADVFDFSFLSTQPVKGYTSKNEKFALWVSKGIAVFAIRKDRNKVLIGLITDKDTNSVIERLRKYGIELEFTAKRDPFWNQLRSCMYAVIMNEVSTKNEEKEEPEEREEEEEREKPESPEKGEKPEEPESSDENEIFPI